MPILEKGSRIISPFEMNIGLPMARFVWMLGGGVLAMAVLPETWDLTQIGIPQMVTEGDATAHNFVVGAVISTPLMIILQRMLIGVPDSKGRTYETRYGDGRTPWL